MNMLSGVSQLLGKRFIFIIVPRLIWDIALFSYLKGFLFVFSRKIKKGEENMKNKFKKSKIIVPALALITATTVASVTGTVAWFTASRTATITGTTFHTTTLNSNLKVKVETLNAGVATPSTNEGNEVSLTVDGLLTHGSYNAQKLTASSETAKDEGSVTTYGADLFTPNMDNAFVTDYSSRGRAEDSHSSSQSGTSVANDKWLAGTVGSGDSTKNVWYGVAWKMTFSVDSLVNGQDTTLHFDPATTKFADATVGGTTIKGLRIALMSKTSFFVAAGDDTKTHVAKEDDRFTYTLVASDNVKSATYEADKYYATNKSTVAMSEDEFLANKYKGCDTVYKKTTDDGVDKYEVIKDLSTITSVTDNTYYTSTDGTGDALTNETFNTLKNKAKPDAIYTRAENTGVETSFADGNFVNVVSKTSMTYPTDNDKNLKQDSNYYLGDISKDSLTVIAVAWFEGTDESIVTSATTVMSDVTASLAFYSRQTATQA